MIAWWVSCPKFTVSVETDELHTITYTAPVTRKFIGQKLGNLIRWFNTFGETEVVNLTEEQERELEENYTRKQIHNIRQCQTQTE